MYANNGLLAAVDAAAVVVVVSLAAMSQSQFIEWKAPKIAKPIFGYRPTQNTHTNQQIALGQREWNNCMFSETKN